MFADLIQKITVADKGDFKLSGNYTLVGFVLAFGLSALVAVLCGYLYAVIVTYMPIIYLNILLNVVFGVIIGFTVTYLSKLALIRNTKARYLIGCLAGLSGVIAQWWVYLFLITTGKIPLEHTVSEGSFLIEWGVLKEILNALYTNGNWSLFGIDMNGPLLLSIWIGEALIIVVAPMLILYKNPITPFSEKYMKWYPKVTLAQDFGYISGIVSFIRELRDSKAENLFHYPKGDGMRHSKVNLYYLEQEDEAFLSVDNVFHTKGNNARKEVDPIVRFVAVPSQTAAQLMDKYGVKKRSIF